VEDTVRKMPLRTLQTIGDERVEFSTSTGSGSITWWGMAGNGEAWRRPRRSSRAFGGAYQTPSARRTSTICPTWYAPWSATRSSSRR
jgi:hypothetical protein